MKCEICCQASECYRYGARVCNGCGSFFRRQILNPKPLYCRYLNNCGKHNILGCKSCRLNRCFEIGMKPEKINFFSQSLPENLESTPVEYVIYAQVLDTLLEVCKEDFEGTVRYIMEGDAKVQDVAAVRFDQKHENRQLNNPSKRIKTWAGILFKHNILQEELPLLFQLLVFQFAFVFYKLNDSSVKFNFYDTNILITRFKQLESMCQRLVNEM